MHQWTTSGMVASGLPLVAHQWVAVTKAPVACHWWSTSIVLVAAKFEVYNWWATRGTLVAFYWWATRVHLTVFHRWATFWPLVAL